MVKRHGRRVEIWLRDAILAAVDEEAVALEVAHGSDRDWIVGRYESAIMACFGGRRIDIEVTERARAAHYRNRARRKEAAEA